MIIKRYPLLMFSNDGELFKPGRFYGFVGFDVVNHYRIFALKPFHLILRLKNWVINIIRWKIYEYKLKIYEYKEKKKVD